VDSETDFVEAGLLDSFAILQLIMQIESEAGIRFDALALTTDAARTAGGLAQLVIAAAGDDGRG
ncbi:MAG: phosphopantetheine-binding protein, partial [Planctomycetota bacterium]